MEIIKSDQAPDANQAANRPTDYDELVTKYNQMQVGDVVRLGHRVSNITLFKRALERRKLKAGTDFTAYNSDDSCYVKRLSNQNMEV